MCIPLPTQHCPHWFNKKLYRAKTNLISFVQASFLNLRELPWMDLKSIKENKFETYLPKLENFSEGLV